MLTLELSCSLFEILKDAYMLLSKILIGCSLLSNLYCKMKVISENSTKMRRHPCYSDFLEIVRITCWPYI